VSPPQVRVVSVSVQKASAPVRRARQRGIGSFARSVALGSHGTQQPVVSRVDAAEVIVPSAAQCPRGGTARLMAISTVAHAGHRLLGP